MLPNSLLPHLLTFCDYLANMNSSGTLSSLSSSRAGFVQLDWDSAQNYNLASPPSFIRKKQADRLYAQTSPVQTTIHQSANYSHEQNHATKHMINKEHTDMTTRQSHGNGSQGQYGSLSHDALFVDSV